MHLSRDDAEFFDQIQPLLGRHLTGVETGLLRIVRKRLEALNLHG
jgi:hypothetical protein